MPGKKRDVISCLPSTNPTFFAEIGQRRRLANHRAAAQETQRKGGVGCTITGGERGREKVNPPELVLVGEDGERRGVRSGAVDGNQPLRTKWRLHEGPQGCQ